MSKGGPVELWLQRTPAGRPAIVFSGQRKGAISYTRTGLVKELEKKLELFGLIEEHDMAVQCWPDENEWKIWVHLEAQTWTAPTLLEALAKFKESLSE